MNPAHDRRWPDELESLLARAESDPAASRELDFLADLAASVERLEARPPAALPERTRWLARAWLLPAAASVLFALALGLWFARRDDAPPAQLALGTPPVFVASTLRGDGTLADELARALEPYTRGDWPAARAALAEFLARHEGHATARFYLAVVAGELGELDSAREHYSAVAACDEPLLADHARYRRARLDLVAGRRAEAESALAELVSGGGPFAELARDALREVAR